MASKSPLCPSARCEDGALLIGRVKADGRVGFLRKALVVNASFVSEALKGKTPEKRFRFSSPCAATKCAQWMSGHCTIPERVRQAYDSVGIEVAGEGSDDCPIRTRCRWYAQAGLSACSLCPYVSTERDFAE